LTYLNKQDTRRGISQQRLWSYQQVRNLSANYQDLWAKTKDLSTKVRDIWASDHGHLS